MMVRKRNINRKSKMAKIRQLNRTFVLARKSAVERINRGEPIQDPCQHVHLLAIMHRKATDYKPYGETECVGFRKDCSCGCRFYIELRGKLSMDWGVCANPISPRCGLLTFEHQGCNWFEDKISKTPTEPSLARET